MARRLYPMRASRPTSFQPWIVTFTAWQAATARTAAGLSLTTR
jgi:hypothetical protein